MFTCVLVYLPSEEIRNEEPDICGALCKATHEIRIPVGSKRDIDAHGIALFHKLLLQITADAVQHLKLNALFW